ncbi:hypothetical protein, partial [Pseudonocardia asaccharolytica]|uniref:Hemerythrin-like domain-containing protein n=1 Tax=Pseudonocardia asaccharolytica DSM 44247 = NBRC 16224 TaxID=1123024 RepID=A0A511CYM6_9PSEU
MTSLSGIDVDTASGDRAWRAREKLRDRGDELLAELAAKVALVTELQLSVTLHEEAHDELARFCRRQVLGLLTATDRVLYAAAAEANDTRLLVRALRTQHDLLAAEIEDLVRANTIGRAALAGHAILALLDGCRRVEQAVLLPAMAAIPGVDLAGLVDDLDAVLRDGLFRDARAPELPVSEGSPPAPGGYARLASGQAG